MSKSETAQIEQLDNRIKSLDNNLSALIKDVESFNEKISKADSSAIEGLKKELSGLQQQYEDFNKKQSKLTKDIDDKLQGLSRSRRSDSKILEYQNKLLEHQKRLLKGDLSNKFSSLQGMMSSIDFESILQKANSAPQRKEAFTSQESLENTKGITEELKKQESQHEKNKKKTNENNEELKKVEMTAARIKTALAAALGIHQIKRFASEILKVRGEFEMSEVALTNIIGNAEKAQTIWEKTMDLAINSPLSAMQLTRYSKQLASFRVETNKLYDTTKMLGDVAVGLGVDMERLILAYGHTKSSGFLRGMYARQFATAGVNIYGELADYYTKLEGHLVTFRDVYERISKKMVSFADVEKVFEKITSEGGTFFNMQEKLTNTVQGQINKIKDTWQQAMNTIGKSDQGFIRKITDIVLNIVKNWRIWLRLIESTAAALIAFKTTQFVAALFSINSAAISASKGMTRLATGIKTLGKSIAANPIGLILTVLTAVGTELYSLYKNMRDYNREIDKNNLVLYNARQKLLDYEERVRANNAAIEEYGKKANKSAEEQDALSKAQSDNANVLSDLRKEYPELADELTQQTNGYVELTKKIDAHNRSLREQIGLNQLMKQENWFNEAFETDAEDYFNKIAKDQAEAIGSIEKMRVRAMQNGIDENNLPQVLQDIINIDWSDPIKGIERYNELLDILFSKNIEKAQLIRDDLLSRRGEYYALQGGVTPEDIRNSDEYRQFLFDYADAFDLLAGKIDLTTHAYTEFARNFVIPEKDDESGKDLPSNAETLARLYLKELETQIGDLSTKDEEGKVKEQFEKWLEEENKNLAEVVLKHGGQINKWTKEGLLTANETTRQVLINQGKAISKDRQNVLNSELQIEIAFIARQEELAEIRAQLAAEEAKKVTKRSKSRIDELRKQVKDGLAAVEKEWDAFVEQTSDGGGGEEKPPTTPTYKNLDELLELLKKMNSEYNKLSKSAYGFAKSQEVVMRNYKDAFDEIFGKDAGNLVNWETLDITSKKGLEDAFKELEKSLNDKNLWGKYGKDVQKLQAKMKKAIADQGVEIEVDAQVRIREDFGKQMEKAFNDYELTLELDKLNIPKDAIKDIFPDFDTETLGELQDRMNAFYESQRDKEGNVLFDEDDLKEYHKWADKIDAEILKSRKEKAKQYSKYLEKEYSERAKLEMQHAKDVAFVTANISDEKQRDNIVANLNRKFQQDLNELNWKSFKESSFYVDMMDDLASLPKEYMQTMLNKIDEILKHPETLSPRALKEAINARQKILEAQMNLEPLDVMKSSIKTIRKAMDDVDGKTWKQTKEKINDQIKTTQKEIDELEEEARKWDEVAAKMKVYEDAADDVENAKNKLSTATKELVDKQGIEATITQYQGEQNENQKLIEGFQKRQQKGEMLSPGEQQQLSWLKERNGELERQIAFLNEIIKLETNLQNIRNEQRNTEASYKREEGYTSTDIGGWSQGLKDKSNKPKQRVQNLKQYLQAFMNFDDSFAKFNAAINSTLNAVQGMGNAFYDMFDALGGETDALTEGWKEFGNTMITQITQTLTMIPMMVAAFAAAGIAINSALGIIGLIAEALQLLFVAIGAIAKLHDAGYEKEIENQKKIIDNLQRAYTRLEKEIEKTWDTASYIRTYNDETQNLYEQIEALNNQIAAEEAKKNADADKIQGYKDSIQDAEDELEELKQKQIEVFGGIGKEGYRDAAQGFVDAWKSAFLETGDGLQGLQDHFDEFLNDWFVKQATMRVAGRMLEPLFRQIDSAVDQYGSGGADVLMQELQNVREKFGVLAPQLSEALEELAGMWGLQGEGGLSGLAAGIQGMTEEQANILEAYWNSVRGYTASIDMNVARIVDMMVANYGGGRSVESNPMLQQLNLIAANTAATHTILQSVTKSGHTMGGSGIKVFVN